MIFQFIRVHPEKVIDTVTGDTPEHATREFFRKHPEFKRGAGIFWELFWETKDKAGRVK